MPLSIIEELPENIPKYGWKIFGKRNGNLYSQCESMSIIRPINKWIKKGKNPKIIASKYPSGFHVLKTREEARECKATEERVKKVLMKNVHTYGIIYTYRIFVCDQIKIIS